jgi:hypothetical protein
MIIPAVRSRWADSSLLPLVLVQCWGCTAFALLAAAAVAGSAAASVNGGLILLGLTVLGG